MCLLLCLLLLLLLLLLDSATPLGTVKVCVRPGDGGWMMRGEKMSEATAGALRAKATAESPAVFRGTAREDLKGFEATMLALVLKTSGITDYEVHAYDSLNKAILMAGRDRACDLVWGMHTQTPTRAWCENTSSVSGIAPCKMLDVAANSSAFQNPTPCCVDFGTPLAEETIGLIVKTPVYQQDLLGALFNSANVNIIAMVVLAVVVAAHVVWLAERHENPEQFPTEYLDGIDDAIWWSATTVTTVGYGDKAPLTTAGRIFALVWMFAGVIFLGLFAGQISTSMERASSFVQIESLADLSATDVVCTPSKIYLSLLEKYPFKHYTAMPLSACVEDLQQGKATAVYFDTPMLKYQFVVSPDLNQKYHTVSGTLPLFSLGPIYAAGKIATPRELEIKRRLNIATLEVQQTTAFHDLFLTWYPESRPNRDADASGEDGTGLNLYLCVPAVCFVVIYWGICVAIYFREENADGSKKHDRGGRLCASKKKEKVVINGTVPVAGEEEHKALEMAIDPGIGEPVIRPDGILMAETKEDSVRVGLHVSLRKKSFMRRGNELKDDEEHASHSQGHRRMLFADGPEFIGLSKELHSVHRIVLEHAQAMERSMMLLRAARQSSGAAAEYASGGSKASIEEVDTSSDEEEEKD